MPPTGSERPLRLVGRPTGQPTGAHTFIDAHAMQQAFAVSRFRRALSRRLRRLSRGDHLGEAVKAVAEFNIGPW